MRGSKREAKRSWRRGRGPNSLREEKRRSIKKNKRLLNRKVRRSKDALKNSSYKKLGKEKAWELVT